MPAQLPGLALAAAPLRVVLLGVAAAEGRRTGVPRVARVSPAAGVGNREMGRREGACQLVGARPG